MLDLALFLGFALLCLYIAYERLSNRLVRPPPRHRRTAAFPMPFLCPARASAVDFLCGFRSTLAAP